MSMSSEPQTRAEMVARYKAARERLNPKPVAKIVPVEPPPLVVLDAPPRRETMCHLIVSFGCWIVKRAPPPLIPYHLQNRIARIQRVVASEMGVRLDEMVSDRRSAAPTLARQVAMWFCKEKTVHSLPEIGDKFCGRDHTTVMHAVRKIERRRHSDPELAASIDRIAAILG